MEWYNVENKLPEPLVDVLIYMPDEKPLPTVHEGYYTYQGIWVSKCTFPSLNVRVTHWANIPEYPESEA